MATLRIKLLGGFSASLDDGSALHIKGRKTQALLAILTLSSGNAVSREKLSSLLWGDRGDEQARGSLRQALAELRRALGDNGDHYFSADRDRVTLNAENLDCDAVALKKLSVSRSSTDLEQITNLYQGDLLDGISIADTSFDEWLSTERSRFADLAQGAMDQLLKYQAEAGETNKAISTGRSLLAIDPLQEQVHRSLMRLYVERGDRNMALKQFHACRDVLKNELGVEPDTETQMLRSEIRAGGDAPIPKILTDDRTETLSLPDKPSIAVLPFANMSGDAEQEYFADGITEDIITELSRFRSLFVIARNSSFTFKGEAVDVTEVGRKLGISYVVEGSVRKSGNRVRISAQLVEAATGNHLWAERYDRELEDIFAVQDEVVQTISSTIGGRVESAGRKSADRLSGESFMAYDHVLRGIAAWLRNTKEDNRKARKHLEQAIDLDPLNPQAHRWFSEVLISDWMSHWVEDRDATLMTAYESAKTAITLDESFSEALATLGSIQVCLRDYGDAQHNLERAIQLNPNDSQALGLYSYFLIAVGRVDEAMTQLELSTRINPFQAEWVDWLKGCAFFTARQYDDAIRILRTIKDPVNEVRGWLAASYVAAGHYDEARTTLAEFLRIAKDDMVVFPGHKPDAWKNYWRSIAVQYRNEADFEHLYTALIDSGIED